MEGNIYLCFNGNAEEAMNFYAAALGGEILHTSRFGEAPMPLGEGNNNKILHATLKAGSLLLMFSDAPAGHAVTFGTNAAISLNCGSTEEADKLFGGISPEGTVTMPLQDTFWGAYFGMCTDKFGVNWMFNYDKPKD